MQNTTLCYIECKGKYLLMHRTKKAHDANEGKWIGIGGHMEEGESPEECAAREIREETGIEMPAAALRYCGIVTFVSDECEGEYMHLFHALVGECGVAAYRLYTEGTAPQETVASVPPLPAPCNEGELQWVSIADMDTLPQWEGDKIFLRLMRQGAPFFSLKLVYKDSHLASATLNGAPYPI